jgi:hypothetical protein
MSYELIGNVEHIGQTESYGNSGGTKRELAINVPDSKYPKTIVFVTFKDKCATLDDLRIGDNVKVKFDLAGKKAANGKYYNSLIAWNVSQEGQNTAKNEQKQAAKPQTAQSRPSVQPEPKNESTPFDNDGIDF